MFTHSEILCNRTFSFHFQDMQVVVYTVAIQAISCTIIVDVYLYLIFINFDTSHTYTTTQSASDDTPNGVQKRKKEDFTFDKIIGEGSYSTVSQLTSTPCTETPSHS